MQLIKYANRGSQKKVIALGISLAVLFWLECPDCCAQAKKTNGITPDAKIQELIRKFVNTPESIYKPGLDEAKKLDELARTKPEVLAPQLVYFSANGKTEIEWVGEVAMMMVLQSDTELRAPIIPLLEADDKGVQKSAVDWLTFFDYGDRKTDLTQYCDGLRKNKESPPPGLVTYLFQFSPGKTLILFGRIHSDQFSVPPRPLVWVDHLVTTVAWRQDRNFLQKGDLEMVRKELDILSKHEGWYARRYVAEILASHPELGTPEILERLRKDTNPLVKAAKKVN